nr:hypothetical protein [Tanacetum cinerariifolium]
MRLDEVCKFSGGTLTSVRSVLYDIASNLLIDYLPKRRWSNLKRQKSRIMIKAIDKLMLERRFKFEKKISNNTCSKKVTPRHHLHDIEDMLLLLVQKKLSNLRRDVIFDLCVALRLFTRHIVILKWVEDLQLGVESYQKKLNITMPYTFKSDISNKTP